MMRVPSILFSILVFSVGLVSFAQEATIQSTDSTSISKAQRDAIDEAAETFRVKHNIPGKMTRYGFGWGVGKAFDSKLVSHSGGQSGTSTYLSILPKQQLCIAIMANLQRSPCAQLDNEIRKICSESFRD